MTDAELEAIDARVEAATPGPWNVGESTAHKGRVTIEEVSEFGAETIATWCGAVYGHGGANAEFIAYARDDVPALLAEVRRLRLLVADRKASLDDFADELESMARGARNLAKEQS